MKYILTAALLLTVLFFEVPSILAAKPVVSPRPSRFPQAKDISDTARPSKSPKVTRVEDDTEGQGKPSKAPNGKLAACERRLEAIKSRGENLTRFTTTVFEVFSRIADNVKAFYVEKGLNIPEYSALNADISAKKNAVLAQNTAAQAIITNFDCTAGDPKASLTQFNDAVKEVKVTLHEYRKSIRNLIVAVHSQSGGGEEGEDDDESEVKPTKPVKELRPTKLPKELRPSQGGEQ